MCSIRARSPEAERSEARKEIYLFEHPRFLAVGLRPPCFPTRGNCQFPRPLSDTGFLLKLAFTGFLFLVKLLSMPVPKKLINFLEKSKVKYQIIEHKTVYTAYDKVQTLKVPEKMVGKTLVFKTDPEGKPSASYGASGKLAVVLIPANKNLDKEKIKKLLKAKKVELVSERLIKNKFKGVKVGAVPPFGNLWGLGTFADKSLINQPKLIVNGGDYNFSIKISSVSFKKLIPELVIGSFSKAKSR